MRIHCRILVMIILAGGCEQLGPQLGDGTHALKCSTEKSLSLRRSMASEMAQKSVASPLPSQTPTPIVMRSPASVHQEKPIRPLQPIQITPESPLGNQTFQIEVAEPGLSLSVISSVIYGTVKRSQKIAEWNHLESLDRIFLGQVLTLKNVSLTSQTDLNRRILPLWREKLARKNEFRRVPAPR